MRTCLITGAGRGIGRAAAVALAERGHRLVLTARTEPELTETAALCRTETIIVPADITAPESVEMIFETAEREFGGVDILVANAGSAVTAPVVRTTDEDWQLMLDLNLTAPFRCVRRALPHMIEQEWGRIVVIGSVASRQGAPYIAAYVAAKHGVLGLVRAAATEVVRSGVTVNAVCPGFVDSPMTDASVARIVARTGRSAEAARAGLESRQPINRLINVEEVASAIMFCVDNGAMTGQGINVDGGAVQS